MEVQINPRKEIIEAKERWTYGKVKNNSIIGKEK
jgi:hypothetical protein